MSVQIKNRWTGDVICEGETIAEAVVVSRANLRGADLRCANLRGANLSCANLRCADLSGANLCGVNFSGATLAWNSHDLIAELLKRAAGGDVAKLKIAGLILVCREKCWADFLDLRDPLTGWAIGVLREWVQAGDDYPVTFLSR